MSPSEAAKLWKEYIEPLASEGYRLGAPATSSDPDGYTWMQEFYKECSGCTIDFHPLHYYDVSASGFETYLKKWHNGFGKPIWVTETACQNFNGGAQCSESEVWSYVEQITSFMESQSWVEKYFYFGFMHDMQGVNIDNQMMSSDNTPTALGAMYLKGSS